MFLCTAGERAQPKSFPFLYLEMGASLGKAFVYRRLESDGFRGNWCIDYQQYCIPLYSKMARKLVLMYLSLNILKIPERIWKRGKTRS